VIVGLPDGSVLVAGGSPGYSSVGRAPVSVTRYHPGRDTWTDERDLPEARFWPLGVALTDGTLLVVGGDHRDGDWAADAYRFSPTLRR
jgi:hypothetical protein